MGVKVYFLRQEAEWLVDWLEKTPDEHVHLGNAKDLAADIRECGGMCSYEESQRYIRGNPPKK